jgi:hypothetical protein
MVLSGRRRDRRSMSLSPSPLIGFFAARRITTPLADNWIMLGSAFTSQAGRSASLTAHYAPLSAKFFSTIYPCMSVVALKL